jgi:ubiquinone/menaquinone biosynthesis C-methylase UbiE
MGQSRDLSLLSVGRFPMDLRNLFNKWGQQAQQDYAQKQWLLSKWEVIEGIDWSPKKIAVMLQSIREGLALDPTHTLVDLGCGGGWILKALKTSAKRVIGLDFSLSMLQHARRYCGQELFVCGDISQLPICENCCDRVLSYFVFLNFMDDRLVEQGIREIFRILRKGGRALIGQLPDQQCSQEYDRAKKDYLDFCRANYPLGKSHREICQAPQKLFLREKLLRFLEGQKIPHQTRDSFNPFYRPGEPEVVKWRFDLILVKD